MNTAQANLRPFSLADRFLGLFRPAHLVQRRQQQMVDELLHMHMQQRAQFKAAETNRLNRNWRAVARKINDCLRAELPTMRHRSRSLFRNNGDAVGFMNGNLAYIIGVGITPNSTVSEGSRPPISDAKTLIKWEEDTEERFEDWAENVNVNGSPSAPESFWDDQKQYLRRVIEDGEALYHGFVDGGRLRTEFLDPEDLDTSIRDFAGNPVTLGVERDKRTGTPVAYHHKLATLAGRHRTVRLEAHGPGQFVSHGFVPFEVGQRRGIPHLAAVMQSFWQLDEYIEAELMANKVSACFSVIISHAADSQQAEVTEGDAVANPVRDTYGNVLSNLQPGIIAHLPSPEAKIEVLQPQRPGATFGLFLENMKRRIAAGAHWGLSYEGMTRDTSKVNFASGRLAQQIDQQGFRPVQGWCSGKQGLITWRTWLDVEVLSGRVKAPGYFDPDKTVNWRRHDWIPSGWPLGINPVQDTTASRIAMRAGVSTLQDECASRGRDWRSNLRKIARMNREATRLGVQIEADAIWPINKGADNPEDPESDELGNVRVTPLTAAASAGTNGKGHN